MGLVRRRKISELLFCVEKGKRLSRLNFCLRSQYSKQIVNSDSGVVEKLYDEA